MTEDIGNITYSLREGAREIFKPERQAELGPRELNDIIETIARLTVVLRRIDSQRENSRAA